MNIRHLRLGLSLFLVLAVAVGCRKHNSVDSSVPPTPYPLSNDTIARIHWLGKKRLCVNADAYYLTRIWELPVSADLEKQTLNRAAYAVAQPSGAGPKFQGVPPQAVYSVFNRFFSDIIEEECFLEIRQPSNQSPEYLLAIRLQDAEAGFWQTNTGALMLSATGTPVESSHTPLGGWSWRRLQPPALIQLSRVPGWVVISVGPERSALVGDVLGRLRNYSNPFSEPATNYWLQADIKPQETTKALGLNWSVPASAPQLSLAVSGDGGNVLTHGELTYPAALPTNHEPWNIPNGLIHEPLTSFTAARGFQSLLAASPLWVSLQVGPPPNQLYCWSQAGSPFETSLAAPLPDAAARVQQVSERLLSRANPWLSAHGYVPFNPLPDSRGVTWGNLAAVKPFLTSVRLGNNDFVFGGLLAGADSFTNPLVPDSVFQPLLAQPNLVYYDWEFTGKRAQPWLQISQMARTILQRPQLPLDSAAGTWLGNIQLRLGESLTQVTQTGPNQLSFDRKSTLGLTAPELHLLIDWLESPTFPSGLHSSLPAAPQR
jgi:hypothetical protein